jgi:hypothetical protein
LIRLASWVGKHHADNLLLLQCNFVEEKRTALTYIFCGAPQEKNKMDGYRVMQVGPDFIVFAGDVGVLKCRTEKDAQAAIAVAMDLLENPNEWWSVLRQRLAAREVAQQSSGMSVDIAAVDVPAPTATLRVLA